MVERMCIFDIDSITANFGADIDEFPYFIILAINNFMRLGMNKKAVILLFPPFYPHKPMELVFPLDRVIGSFSGLLMFSERFIVILTLLRCASMIYGNIQAKSECGIQQTKIVNLLEGFDFWLFHGFSLWVIIPL